MKILFLTNSFILLLLIISGCNVSPTNFNDDFDSSAYTATDITNQPFQGEIGGVIWSFVSGMAETSLVDSTKFSISLYDTVIDGSSLCDAVGISRDFVLGDIPMSPGEYPMNSDNVSITFWQGAVMEFNKAFEGILIVESVTDFEISISLYAKYDNFNFIDGKAILTICD